MSHIASETATANEKAINGWTKGDRSHHNIDPPQKNNRKAVELAQRKNINYNNFISLRKIQKQSNEHDVIKHFYSNDGDYRWIFRYWWEEDDI